MRLTHWRPGPGRPLLPITAGDAEPVYIGGGRDALNVLALSLYGVASADVIGLAATPPSSGTDAPGEPRIEGEVVLDHDGQRLRARPGQAAAPDAPADRLIIDVAHPAPDWRWLSAGHGGVAAADTDAIAPAGDREQLSDERTADPARRVHEWLQALVDGQAGLPAAETLQRELGEIDRLLAEAEMREQAHLPGSGQAAGTAPNGTATPTPTAGSETADARSADARSADALPALSVEERHEASGYAIAFADLRAGMQAVEGDLAAISQTIEEEADDARRAGLVPDGEAPSPSELVAMAEELAELRRAISHRDEAVAEAIAAANTADVVRHGALRAQAPRRRFIAQLQPVLLGLSASLVVVAVVELVRGLHAVGVVSGVAAVVAATGAFLMPSRSSLPTATREQLEARAARAEDESSRWQIEAGRRASEVSRLATQLTLPPDPTELDLGRLDQKIADWHEQRARTDGLTRNGEVATNTSSAAIDRQAYLRAQQLELQSRETALEASWGAWCEAHRVPAWWSAEDVAAGHPADLTNDGGGDPTELRQARQCILDQLGRLYWEADRLALTQWLLERAAGTATAGAGSSPSGRDDRSSAGRPSPAPVHRPPAVALWTSPEQADELRRRTSHLVSELRHERLTLAVDGRGELVLIGPDGALSPLDEIDGQTLAIIGMCLRVAAAEQASLGRLPVLVRAPGTTSPPHNSSPMARLLGDLASHTQVLVVTDGVLSDQAGHAESDPGGHEVTDLTTDVVADLADTHQDASVDAPGETNEDSAGSDIRVLVTPTE